MILEGTPLALYPPLLPSVKALLAEPRPKISYAQQQAGRVADVEITGILWPAYMVAVRERIQRHTADPTVRAIRLLMDSPGGTVAGTPELAEVVKRAAAVKPVHVIAENYLASAAYWIACQATTITASRSTQVGSIGAFLYVIDSSELFRKEGLRAVVARSGEHKGVGAPGVEISEANVEWLKELVEVDLLGFQAAVERGRKLSRERMDEVSTGASWSAPVAKTLKLIDAVALPEDRYAEIENEHAEQFTTLAGGAAKSKLDDLCWERFGCLLFKASADAKQQLQHEFPSLVSAVDRFNSPPARAAASSRRFDRRMPL